MLAFGRCLLSVLTTITTTKYGNTGDVEKLHIKNLIGSIAT